MTHTLTIFLLVVVSIWLHELGHALACRLVGDRLGARRWALNPLVNLDPVLSVIVPLGLSLLTGGWLYVGIGRPFLLSRADWRVIAAGPAVNLLLLVLGLLGNPDLARVNGVLLVVNLLPVRPLDGWALLHEWREKRELRRMAIERLRETKPA